MTSVSIADPAAITAIGDASVQLPLALLVLLVLAGRDRRWALLWAASVIGCCAIVAGFKVLYYLGLSPLGNVSGHSAMSALVLGGMARFAPTLFPCIWPLPLRISLLSLCGLIGASRVMLDYHTVGEVAAGLTLGLAGMGALFLRPLPVTVASNRTTWMVLVLVPLTYGRTVSMEPILQDVAHGLAGSLNITMP